jgi:hypothetical protein
MTTTILSHPSHIHEISTDDARRRQLRLIQLIFAGAAAFAMLVLYDAARPDTPASMLNSASVHLAGMAVPAPASGPVGGFAADDGNDQAQQQLQQQIAQQQMQQAEQQAEQQNEAAQQQALQDELQGQQVEQQAGQ